MKLLVKHQNETEDSINAPFDFDLCEMRCDEAKRVNRDRSDDHTLRGETSMFMEDGYLIRSPGRGTQATVGTVL